MMAAAAGSELGGVLTIARSHVGERLRGVRGIERR